MADPPPDRKAGEVTYGRRRRRNGDSDLRQHLHALGRFWPSLALLTVLGTGLGFLISAQTTPVYEVTTTFFAAAQGGGEGDQLQQDEFAQRRINSYIGVVRSERVAQIIQRSSGVDLTLNQISDRLSASVDPDTVLLNVRVRDTNSDRAMLIAGAMSRNLDEAVAAIDPSGSTAGVQLTIISGPTLTPYPVAPRTKLNVAIGLLIGLGLGIGQALLREQIDQTFHSRDELAEESGFPVLGVLYYDRAARKRPVLSEQDGLTRRAEAYRHLRTNLRFLDAASPVAVLVVTSTTEREGKTSTSANLALTLAAAGRKVLLVDADLRRPAMSRYLDIEGGAGLTNALVDHVDCEHLVQYWGPDRLAVLASGPIPPNPSELLSSPAMDKLLRDLRNQYDITIIDTPPLGPVTDAAVIAAKADGAILAVRYGSTKRDRVFSTLESLAAVDARVLGTVLTMCKDRRKNRSSYYYDGGSESRSS